MYNRMIEIKHLVIASISVNSMYIALFLPLRHSQIDTSDAKQRSLVLIAATRNNICTISDR